MRITKTFNEDNTVCYICPEKLPEGLRVACTAKPNEIHCLGHSMSLEAAQLLIRALTVAIIVAEGMVKK